MSIHDANPAFYASYMRLGMLAECEDFRIWWKVWCGGHEL